MDATTLGFSSGACFILGLSFISLRTDNSTQAASLSGMSQSIGYLLAAIGPMVAGALHTSTGSWSAPLGWCRCRCVSVLHVDGLAAKTPRLIIVNLLAAVTMKTSPLLAFLRAMLLLKAFISSLSLLAAQLC
ncbi:hypothetical protein P4S68_17355 [Pseudoalteromonas sp. Hal099]